MAISLLSCILLMWATSCTEKNPGKDSDQKIVFKKNRENVVFSSNTSGENALTQEIKKVTPDEFLKDFEKPLQSYPQINSSMTVYGDNGLVYRKDIEIPFSGRLIDKSEEGIALLEVSYLDGQPHGQQLRRSQDGKVLMEAFFKYGSLTGIKTKWWPNGTVKEEEYWDEGTYKGRCIWDETGRLYKEERTK